MFGAYIRAAGTVAVAVLSAAVLQFAVPFLLPYQGAPDSMLYQAFSGVADNALIIMLFAIAAGVLARSVTESGVR